MSSGAPQPAARLHDPVAHSHALGGFVGGALVGLAAAAGVAIVVGMAATAIAAEVATAGLATPLVAGVAVTVGEFAVNAVVGGALMGLAEDAGEALGSQSMGAPSGEIGQGSPDVSINNLPAARVTDAETCDAGKVAQGSATVFINGLPAARVGDKVTCGAVIVAGSGNVFIGGGTTSPLPIQSEVPEWARWAAVVVGILPALGGAARAIGPALAEVEATGLIRAAQTGVKALGRQMEARAGEARLPSKAPRSLAESEHAADVALAGRAARGETVPEGIPLSQAKFDELRNRPKLDRPENPRDYLPSSYVDAHLAQFDNGGSYLTPTHYLNEYGRAKLGRDDGVFMMPKHEMDALMVRTGGDIGKIEAELGIPAGEWQNLGSLSRIDIADPRSLGLRLPNGREAGANPKWMPGGKLPGGGSEAVTNQIPEGSFIETIIGDIQ